MIPYGRQTIDKDDLASVKQVLESDWLTQGPTVQNFEEKVSEYTDSKYAVATNSATSALHVACKALELGAGDIFGRPQTRLLQVLIVLYTVVRRWILSIFVQLPLTCVVTLLVKN